MLTCLSGPSLPHGYSFNSSLYDKRAKVRYPTATVVYMVKHVYLDIFHLLHACALRTDICQTVHKSRAALIIQMPCGRGLGNASVITLRSRLDIKVTRTNIREATMGSIGGCVFTT